LPIAVRAVETMTASRLAMGVLPVSCWRSTTYLGDCAGDASGETRGRRMSNLAVIGRAIASPRLAWVALAVRID
jgi:hypothetical protein